MNLPTEQYIKKSEHFFLRNSILICNTEIEPTTLRPRLVQEMQICTFLQARKIYYHYVYLLYQKGVPHLDANKKKTRTTNANINNKHAMQYLEQNTVL